MKTMIVVLSPRESRNLLNGDLSILVRKKFSKDYVGWVYIYVSKDNNNLLHKNCADIWWVEDKYFQKKNKLIGIKVEPIYNGKVVARFWCDNVEKFDRIMIDFEKEYLKQNACISPLELDNYIKDNIGYAVHISDLEIFDKPKEIKEFYKVGYEKCVEPQGSLREKVIENYNNALKYQLTRAPRSGWCYVEV